MADGARVVADLEAKLARLAFAAQPYAHAPQQPTLLAADAGVAQSPPAAAATATAAGTGTGTAAAAAAGAPPTPTSAVPSAAMFLAGRAGAAATTGTAAAAAAASSSSSSSSTSSPSSSAAVAEVARSARANVRELAVAQQLLDTLVAHYGAAAAAAEGGHSETGEGGGGADSPAALAKRCGAARARVADDLAAYRALLAALASAAAGEAGGASGSHEAGQGSPAMASASTDTLDDIDDASGGMPVPGAGSASPSASGGGGGILGNSSGGLGSLPSPGASPLRVSPRPVGGMGGSGGMVGSPPAAGTSPTMLGGVGAPAHMLGPVFTRAANAATAAAHVVFGMVGGGGAGDAAPNPERTEGFAVRGGTAGTPSSAGGAVAARGSYTPLPFAGGAAAAATAGGGAGESSAAAQFGPPEIPYADIVYDEQKDVVGEGAFGHVYAGTCRGLKVAVKVPRKQVLDEAEAQSFEREVEALRRVFHPRVVLFLGGCTRPDPAKGEKIALVMEFVPMDLERILKQDRKLLLDAAASSTGGGSGAGSAVATTTTTATTTTPPAAAAAAAAAGSGAAPAAVAAGQDRRLSMAQRVRFALDAAVGMNWLHAGLALAHRDIKAANFLVDASGTVKVADFGFAVFRDDKTRSAVPEEPGEIIGTPLYMAPEMLAQDPDVDPFRGDVYAFGLVLWELATSMKLFEAYEDWDEFVDAVATRKVRPPVRGGQGAPPLTGAARVAAARAPETSPAEVASWAPQVPPSLAALMQSCWSSDPAARPSFAEVVFRLEECMVDVNLACGPTRAFWKERFLTAGGENRLRDEVGWDEFAVAVTEATGVPGGRVGVLQPLLARQAEGFDYSKKWVVTMESVNAACRMFGSVCTDATAVHCAADALLAPWWADGERHEVEARVNQYRGNDLLPEPGRFCIRPRAAASAADGAPFAVTSVRQGKIQHRLLHHNPLGPDRRYFLRVAGRNRAYDSFADMLRDPDTHLRTPAYAVPPDEDATAGYEDPYAEG